MPKVIQSSNAKFVNKNFTIDKTNIKIGDFFTDKIPLDSVTNSKVEVNQHVGKSVGGTIGGAIVGGILTGGIGAIVGGMACGNNKIRTTKTASIEFGNKEWIIVEFGSGFIDDTFFNETQRLLGSFQLSPFAG